MTRRPRPPCWWRLAVVALACLVPALLPGSAAAAFPGGNGQIAFSAGGISRIYAADLNGGGRQRLSPTGLHGGDPAYSSDGRRIAFDALAYPYEDGYSHIYTINAEGSRLRRLTREKRVSHFDAAFSPGGRKIAFTRNAAARPDIYIMNADGSNPRLVAMAGMSPTFSPDGRTIVFAGVAERAYGLYSIRANGTDERQLSYDARRNASPDFSPDGRRIAFVRVSDVCCAGSIYVMGVDGRNRRRLTGRMQDSHPAFSPDGRMIAFDRFAPRSSGRGLWVMNSDGTGRRALRGGRLEGSGPSWQPVAGRTSNR